MKLLLVCVLSVFGFSGCLADNESNYFNGFKYWIFISDNFTPESKTIKKGDLFGNHKTLSAGQIDSYGKIEVTWDGKLEASFDQKGSIFLARNKGELRLSGVLKKPLCVVIIKSESKTTGRVIEKKTLKAGIVEFAFNCK